MILLIVLRLLLFLKWIFQILGIGLSIVGLGDSVGAFFALTFLIIPELIMGAVLWISNGASSVYKLRNPHEKTVVNIPIFGKTALIISFLGYIAVLTSLSLLFGEYFKTPILFSGLTLLLCCVWRRKLNDFFDKYLTIDI